MTSPRLAAALTAALLSITPAAALAQSAGDEQSEDPLAGEAPVPADETGTLTEEAPDLGEEIPDTSGEPAPAPAPDDPEAGEQLPATGGEAAVIGLLGTGMVLAGTGLRLRLRTREGL